MDTRYNVVAALAGEGGFGKISKAQDTELGRFVAIKTLDPLFKAGPSDADKERFRREAKTLASLSHPSIPAIYDVQFATADGEFRIIFEWIEGKTLRDRLRGDGPLTLDEAQRWFGAVCSALTHAHGREVIHRDIRPSNVIVSDTSGSAYLVDFGIALRKSDLDRLTSGTAVGSPGYMSPEQEHGDELKPASDVYSLAITLYECLAGQRPQLAHYQALNGLNESIPPGVDELLRACLGIGGRPRIQSASEFADGLSRALRPHASFAVVLTEGALHEVQLALMAMHPEEYIQLPAGQKRLLKSRLNDLMKVDEPKMRSAVARYVAGLVRAACLGQSADYEALVRAALDYGYERQMSETFQGNREARDALKTVARDLDKAHHAVLCQCLLGHFSALKNRDGLSSKERWYFHDMRILLQNMLANPYCSDEAANGLGEALDEVNQISHAPFGDE